MEKHGIMKPINQLMKEIRQAGLIYDGFVTSTIINYEAGHLVRNCFYASMIDAGREDEELLKAGWLANGRVELSDLITQARVLAAVYGWDWDELVDTGEAKLTERIDTYKQRGVRPNDKLLKSFAASQAIAIEFAETPITPESPMVAQRRDTMRRFRSSGD